MAKDNEAAHPTANERDQLQLATDVLVRMAGMGCQQAQRFLGRCTQQEIEAIADCDAPLDCQREVGDKFRSTFGTVMDGVTRRQKPSKDS